MCDLQKLPKTLPLGEYEPATTYACRLATLWRAPSATQFWDDVGIPLRAIAMGKGIAIEELAYVSGADGAKLGRYSPVRLSRDECAVGREVLSRAELAHNRMRVCPECLAGDIAEHPELRPDQAAHFRIQWAIQPIQTCFRHQRALVSIANEFVPIQLYYDFGFRVGLALSNLAELQRCSIPQRPSEFETYLWARIDGE